MTAAFLDYKVVNVDKPALFMRLLLALATDTPANIDAIYTHSVEESPQVERFLMHIENYNNSGRVKTFEVRDQHNRWTQLSFSDDTEHCTFSVPALVI